LVNVFFAILTFGKCSIENIISDYVFQKERRERYLAKQQGDVVVDSV